jgi:hypothetical protein
LSENINNETEKKEGKTMRRNYVLALLLAIVLIGSSSQLLAADNVKVGLVRLDWSDCVNSDVAGIAAAYPDLVEGFINVHLEEEGKLLIIVHLKHGAPGTTYNVYLKCIGPIGSLYTNPLGVGNAIFTVPSDYVGPVFAFDMYPDGAPLGYKYQSVQVNLAQ